MSRQQLFYTTTQQCVVSERIYHKTGSQSRGNKRRQIFMRALGRPWPAECPHKNLTPLCSDQATFESATTRSISFLRRMRSAPTTRPTSEPFLKMIKVGIPWTRRRDGVEGFASVSTLASSSLP